MIGEVVWSDRSAKISRRTGTGPPKAASEATTGSAIPEPGAAASKASGTTASKGAATTAAATTAKDAAAAAAKASAATTAHPAAAKAASSTTGKTVFPDFERTALPVVAIELGDGIPCIFWSFERYDAATLGTTIGTDVDIGTDHST